MTAWLAWLSIRAGLDVPAGEAAAFVALGRGGKPGDRLSRRDVSRILERLAARAEIETIGISAHSLRATLPTIATAAGVSNRRIRRLTGRASDRMVDRHVRPATAWADAIPLA